MSLYFDTCLWVLRHVQKGNTRRTIHNTKGKIWILEETSGFLCDNWNLQTIPSNSLTIPSTQSHSIDKKKKGKPRGIVSLPLLDPIPLILRGHNVLMVFILYNSLHTNLYDTFSFLDRSKKNDKSKFETIYCTRSLFP